MDTSSPTPPGGGIPQQVPVTDTFHIRDPEALRAISHPMRQRILLDLMGHGHARAADLAGRFGVPANAISFHLRVLAKVGMIVEAPELARDKRDRVWAPVSGDYELDPTVAGIDTILDDVVGMVRDNLALAARGDPPVEGAQRTLSVRSSMLTRGEAKDMIDEVNALLERWADRGMAGLREHPDAPDREVYRIVFAVGPTSPAGGVDDPAEPADPVTP